MAYNVLDIARYVINYANEKEAPISNLKLQKVIYYIQAVFLVEKGEKCFNEDILNWSYGPVVQEVYNEYRVNGNKNIERQDEYSTIELNKSTGTIDFITKKFKDEIINECDKKIIKKVVDNYSDSNAFDLVKKTHKEGPWSNSKQNDIIDTKDIKSYYLKNRERLYR